MNLRMPGNSRSISGKLSSSMSKTVTRVERDRVCETKSSSAARSGSLHAATPITRSWFPGEKNPPLGR